MRVRHTLECIFRRFGEDDLYAATAAYDEAGARCVLLSVRKRKEHAGKWHAAGAVQDEDDESHDKDAPVGDVLEDVLYGSGSEVGDSDNENDGGYVDHVL
jgi:ribosomal RNA-processing protein 12